MMDVWFILPAVFTLLLIITGAFVMRNNQITASPASIQKSKQTQLCDKDNKSKSMSYTERDLEEETTDNKSETPVTENHQPANSSSDGEEPLRYMPGMLRTSQLEKMMSKEELEEERRVQQEQLAAIFRLLKENQETFGEVSEKDMEDQLKLYSI